MKHILSYMRKAIEDYNMIEDGDKIAVALSGGKDSITMLKALKNLQIFYPKKFELIAISVNPGFEFFDSAFLQETCDDIGVPFFEEKYDIKTIVFEDRKEKNPCSLETFLMNLFFAGSLSTFAPVTYMDRSGMTVVRPLVYTPEKETKRFVRKNNISVMPKVCPMDGHSTREDMKNLIVSLSVKNPYVKASIIGAIKRNNINGWKDVAKHEKNNG